MNRLWIHKEPSWNKQGSFLRPWNKTNKMRQNSQGEVDTTHKVVCFVYFSLFVLFPFVCFVYFPCFVYFSLFVLSTSLCLVCLNMVSLPSPWWHARAPGVLAPGVLAPLAYPVPPLNTQTGQYVVATLICILFVLSTDPCLFVYFSLFVLSPFVCSVYLSLFVLSTSQLLFVLTPFVCFVPASA